MIALTASTPPRSSTAATGVSATGSPSSRMRSSRVSVHLELPLATAMCAACQTLRASPGLTRRSATPAGSQHVDQLLASPGSQARVHAIHVRLNGAHRRNEPLGDPLV